jgi:ATP phosphoribosyltransferase regulatory subunit HisZ
MGFRADITPQVARIDAHTLRREGPSRLCYAGSVLHAQPRALSSSRSPIQLGAELYGDASPSSDVEVISLMLAMLQLADVPDVHMDLGHVGIYRGLARAAGLSGEVEQQLFDALQRKAIDEVIALTEGVPADLAGMLRALVDLCGGREVLTAARDRLANAPARCWRPWTTCWRLPSSCRRASRNCRCILTWVSCAATTTTPVWCSRCLFRALAKPSPRAVVMTISAPTSVVPVRRLAFPPI